MSRSMLVCALMAATASALGAQQGSQSSPYEGTSNPPPNETIVSSAPEDAAPAETPAAKPSPAHAAGTPHFDQSRPEEQPVQESSSPADSALTSSADGTDNGIVRIAPDEPARSGLDQRAAANDPDGDIVHPAPLGSNEVGEGTMIRVRLLNSVSTAFSEEGDSFSSRVASDVLQDGKVLIPAGSEIDGKVAHVTTGAFAGHGSMRLSPDTVILPDGSRFRMYALVTATPGSNTKIGSEGSINPGSRMKRDGLEYGGAVGAGAITGAVLGGPAGALAGSLVGAGVITAHLLVSHPQATLDQGTVLEFMLTEPLNLVPAASTGN